MTKDTSLVYNDNYTKINQKIGDDLNRWGLLPHDFGNQIDQNEHLAQIIISLPIITS